MSFVNSLDRPVALLDLGDTLANCRSALLAGMTRFLAPGESDFDDRVPLPPHLEERRREVLSTPGFWRELRPRPEGFELLDILRSKGFAVHVVTKGPYYATSVWAEKVAWCRVHVPDLPVIVTDDKTRIHGDVLVDDWMPYVDAWLSQWQTGLAIVPAQPWNVDAISKVRCLRDDEIDREKIIAALSSIAMKVARGCS